MNLLNDVANNMLTLFHNLNEYRKLIHGDKVRSSVWLKVINFILWIKRTILIINYRLIWFETQHLLFYTYTSVSM